MFILKRRSNPTFFLFMEDNILYGQQNFTLPHDVVKLPSLGKFYNHKKKSIKVGYLTAADENILMAGNTAKDGVVMTLLRNKIYEPEIKPEELLNGDIQAILIFLRNTAFGSEYEMNVTDPETGKIFKTTISLEELSYKIPEVESDENGLFTTVLPKSGSNVKLRLMNFKEYSDLDRMAETYPVGRIAPKQTWRLQKTIVEIDGISDLGTIAQKIESLPILDSKYIRNFIEKNEPGLDLKRRIIAPSGRELSIDIAFGVEFFRPFF